MPNKLSFENWFKQVNAILSRRIGLTADDLADCCYRDWYDDGVTPASAARLAIKENQD